MASTSQLFRPIKIGNIVLQHRVVLAPLTRFKAMTTTHVPVVSLMKEYYSQRSSVRGSLLITEATVIAAKATGKGSVPGAWSDDQINAWKEITDAVHANGSYIFLQLWAFGRSADPAVLAADSEDPSNPLPYVAPSPIPLSGNPTAIPRELTIEEIQEYTQLYATAAKNAVFKAGFDGVEVHGANGYLIEQFLKDTTNQRTDEYGGSIENRSKFALEVVDAVVKAVGAKKTGVRLSPWSTFMGAHMADPVPQYTHLVTELKAKHPDLAYMHIVEPRVSGIEDREAPSHESNDFIRDIWAPRPLISAGGYTRATALQAAEKGELIAFGRWYISNPDLPRRLKEDIPLTQYDRKTFYRPASAENPEVGYLDYPFAPLSGQARPTIAAVSPSTSLVEPVKA